MSVFQRHSLVPCTGFKQYQYSMYVSVPKALISTMQGFQTKLVLNVCQCSKGTHQYHARVSSNISTQYMSVFQRHSLVTCKGFKQYQYSMYVSVPKALISTMQGFQTILVLNVCQCSKGTHQYHARVSNNISTQCMSVFQRHSLVSNNISTHAVFQRVSNNISTQCMSVFQRHSLVPCKGFKQYQYSMYVSVPKALISTMQGFQTILVLNVCQCSLISQRVSNNIITLTCMQGFQTILVLNVCQCSKGTHQYHARVSNNISTQCMSVFQRHSLVTCKGFKQYYYSMYVNVAKALISTMQGFQTILVLNVCQCSKGTHQYHARVSNNISTQCMSVFQRHSLIPCKGFNQYQYSMYVSIPKAPISTMQGFQTILVLNVCQCLVPCKGFKQYQYSMYVSVPKALISNMHRFQTILVLNVCQCSKGTHQYHARVSNKIGTQCMPVFQRHSLVPCKGFKQYQYSMYVSVPKALISTMQGFQTILLLNVCQCCKSTHQYHARVSNNISTQCMSVFRRHSLVPCKGFKQYQYSMYVSIPKAFIPKALNVCHQQHHARVSNNISTQCMSVFQSHSFVTCKGFKRYQYSMYVSVPKALINTMQGFQPILVLNVSIPKAPISTMQGFQTILVLNVCQCSKGSHQYHARVSNNISTQCMSVFQRHSLVTCTGFKQYQYSMYVSVPKALISTMQGFQTKLVLNVCQCSKGTHQYHARVSSNISTQCMSVFQRHSLVTCKGFKQYQYSMYVSVPNQHKALIIISTQCMSVFQRHQYHGFQTILVLNVCQCSKGTHQYHARVSNNISTQCMSVFQRHSLVHARVSINIITQSMSMFQRHSLVPCKGFQTILVLNVCQCSKGTHQ